MYCRGGTMDFGPIFKSQHANDDKTLHIGVEIRYEENDAEYLVHILRFLEAYAEEQGKKFTLIPTITHDGNNTKAKTLLAQFEKHEEGRRLIRGVVSIHFLDEMRPVFEAYKEALRQIKDAAKKSHEWDELHPFFIPDNCFELITPWFFPNKTTMH
jgi:uncharacterized protein YdiU (UPF0061 family)